MGLEAPPLRPPPTVEPTLPVEPSPPPTVEPIPLLTDPPIALRLVELLTELGPDPRAPTEPDPLCLEPEIEAPVEVEPPAEMAAFEPLVEALAVRPELMPDCKDPEPTDPAPPTAEPTVAPTWA